jgi:hypothetical protein
MILDHAYTFAAQLAGLECLIACPEIELKDRDRDDKDGRHVS